MADIIDFEDKRKKKTGNQNVTEGEGYNEQGKTTPDSENDSQESVDLELADVSMLKTSGNKSAQAERLLRLAHENATFFHTPSDEPFGCLHIGNHQEIWSLRSKPFKIWLRRLLYEDIGKIPYNQALQDTLMQLEGDALFNGPCHEVYIRIASYNEAIYVDMANDNWEQIEITQKGWQKVAGDESPVKFKRTLGMLPLSYPVRNGTVNILGEFLNVESESALQLIAGWLIGTIKSDGPFPILLLQGEQGSAKSTTARLLKYVIDPSSVLIRTPPQSERDLIIAASNCWILNFDNLSSIQVWMSDALCRIATGSGFGTRTLHTNDSESLFSASRPIILNGISDIATRNDLAERCLIVHLPPMKSERRMTEKELKMKWEDGVGCIRAALFEYHRSFEVSFKDEVVPGISIGNSEIGCLSFCIECFYLRLVCTNGLTVEVGETKNNEGRTVCLDQELRELFLKQWEKRKKSGKLIPYVFTNKFGSGPIKDFRYAWNKACRKAGLGYGYKFTSEYVKKWQDELPAGPILRDFRRTAVRNMVRAGIPERVAMMISGHKTRSVFDRYNIVNDSDLKMAARLQEEYLSSATGTKSGTIADFEEKKRSTTTSNNSS